MIFLAISPFLKTISVGIDMTSYWADVIWFSSTLSLTTRRSSPRSSASSSSVGAMTRQGPHQGAQKSTSTGVSASSTSAWKLLSVTSEIWPATFGSLLGRCRYTKYSDPVGSLAYGPERLTATEWCAGFDGGVEPLKRSEP